MEKTTRRNLLKSAAVGGVAATGLGTMLGSERSVAAHSGTRGGEENEHKHGAGGEKPLSGKRAQASVAFGQWDANPDAPYDRYPLVNDRTRNIHELLPFEAEVDEGGAVSFIISGAHQILIYETEGENGRTLEDLQTEFNTAVPQPAEPPLAPGGPALVNIPRGRFYRGLDPRRLVFTTAAVGTAAPTNYNIQDRVESVNFPKAGQYLVVCGLVPHFNEGMHGFVRVHGRD